MKHNKKIEPTVAQKILREETLNLFQYENSTDRFDQIYPGV